MHCWKRHLVGVQKYKNNTIPYCTSAVHARHLQFFSFLFVPSAIYAIYAIDAIYTIYTIQIGNIFRCGSSYVRSFGASKGEAIKEWRPSVGFDPKNDITKHSCGSITLQRGVHDSKRLNLSENINSKPMLRYEME